MARTKGYPEALDNKLRDRYIYGEDSNPEFTKTVEKISMTIPHMCYQCGTCTASCPSCSTKYIQDQEICKESTPRAR